MMNYPIFSIVTPSYNQGSYIGGTIESVVTQAGDFYIDYIIMDGGSSDSTLKIIQESEKKIQKDSRTETLNGQTFYSGNASV
ncbi:MAG TPA: glycosyltransferase, partial [Leptospiraceae bacterium]|nr:glycosyltransferase [Leptospiraceae bacterium]